MSAAAESGLVTSRGFWIEPGRVFAVAPQGGTRADLSDGFHTFGELYRERSALVAALARAHGHAYVARDNQPGFDGFRTVLYIDLPTGQVSWHFSDADAEEFLGEIPRQDPIDAVTWDGHSTSEKYARVERYAKGA